MSDKLLKEVFDRFPTLQSRKLPPHITEILSTELQLSRELKPTMSKNCVLDGERLKEESLGSRLKKAIRQLEFENERIASKLIK